MIDMRTLGGEPYSYSGESYGELKFNLGGGQAGRPIRVVWKYTPEWPHHVERDGVVQRLADPDDSLAYHLEVELDPLDSCWDMDAADPQAKKRWECIDLLDDGFLGKAVEEAIEQDIERQCEAMDKALQKKKLPD